MKKKFLSIYFPNWSINLVQRNLPIAAMLNGTLLTYTENNQLLVARACPIAIKFGAKERSPLTLAKAFSPQANVAEYDPVQDFKNLYSLAVWGYKFSPLVGLDIDLINAYKEKALMNISPRHQGINIDITGTDKVHKSERALIDIISQKLLKGRLDAKFAIAPTLGAAWALSRFSYEKIHLTRPETLLESLAALPIESLRLPSSIADALRKVGIKELAMLYALPRKKLLERYGKECLLRMDQATGEVPERVFITPPPNRWAVFREFDYPLAMHEKIVSCVVTLLEELIAKVKERGRKAKIFIALFEGESIDGDVFQQTKEFSLFSATKNKTHIISVIYPLVESLKIPGPVSYIALTTRETVKDSAVQKDFNGDDENKNQTDELLNHFVAHLGREQVTTVTMLNSYVPEKSYTYTPVDEANTVHEGTSLIRNRPSYLLQQPEEVGAVAMLPDRPPAKIYWKDKELIVKQGIGPEQIRIPWWQEISEDISSRDYFKLEDHTGRWIWVFRENISQKWFVHGLWL